MDRKQKMSGDMFLISMILLASVICLIFLVSVVSAVDPIGPNNLYLVANETKGAVGAAVINISGGRIATMNLTATVQNPRWKAFVGNVTGRFTLDDSSGSTIYDWSLSSITGRVYATRNSSSVTWASVNCSNGTTLSVENLNMNHTNPDDNISRTFNATNMSLATGFGTHSAFYVGSRYISANSCPTLNVYRNNASNDAYWEEAALYDNSNIVYAAIIQDNEVGFDSNRYDFQMIVPEVGLSGFSGSTAYYIYLEIGV